MRWDRSIHHFPVQGSLAFVQQPLVVVGDAEPQEPVTSVRLENTGMHLEPPSEGFRLHLHKVPADV